MVSPSDSQSENVSSILTRATNLENKMKKSALVASALFDFMGYLTTREQSITVGSNDTCYDIMNAFQDWAKTRNLDLTLGDNDIYTWSQNI